MKKGWLLVAVPGLLSFRPQTVSVWEKPIAPGLVYRSEIDRSAPRMIHVIKTVGSSPVVSIRGELAGRTIYDGDGKGQGLVSKIVKDENAIGAINADYFPFTGDPLGLMVRRGELISLPNPRRAVLAWGPKQSVFGFSRFTGTVEPESGNPFAFENLNEDCPENRITLNTPDAGKSMCKFPCQTAILRVNGGKIGPSTVVTATVVSVSNSAGNMPLSAGQFTVVGSGNKAPIVGALRPGQQITISTTTAGFDWTEVEHAISGGPMLMRDGNVYIDAENEGFPPDFSTTRHPRTAVGRTTDGDLVFVVVDGRQATSVGASLAELAEIMQRLGCRDAINLDGGGSTVMNLFGLNVSRPSDKTGERPVANGIAFFGPRQISPELKLKIEVPASATVGQPVEARVVEPNGTELPNIEVIWAAQGSAGWIDQGGTVTPLEPGELTVSAYIRGRMLTTRIKVKPAA